MNIDDFYIPYDSPLLTPLKQNNLQYNPSQQQIISYAEQVLEINPITDKELVYLAQQALKASLPTDWEACQYSQNTGKTQNQNNQTQSIIVYRNKKTQIVIFQHPLDSIYKQKARQLKLMKNTAKYSQNVTPIHQQMLQSSLIMFKNNSSNNQLKQSNSVQNNSSNRLKNSFKQQINKGQLIHRGQIAQKNQLPHKNKDYLNKNNIPHPHLQNEKVINKKQFQRNKTQQSLIYEEDEEFDNFSLITQNQELDDEWRIQKINQQDKLKSNIKNIKLKQKPKVLKPKKLFISQQQTLTKQTKPKKIQLIANKNVKMVQKPSKKDIKKVRQISIEDKKNILKQIILQRLKTINKKHLQNIQKRVNKQLRIQQIENRILQMKISQQNCRIRQDVNVQKDSQIILNNNHNKKVTSQSVNKKYKQCIPQSVLINMKYLKDKQKQLRKLQLQNKVLDSKIQKTIQMIQIQSGI